MSFSYLIGLIVAILCMGLIDWRYKLAFFGERRRTVLTVGIALAAFIVWDILGIALGIFFYAGSPYVLPIRLLPEFPIEELFFLTLLVYSTLVVYRLLARRRS